MELTKTLGAHSLTPKMQSAIKIASVAAAAAMNPRRVF